MTEITASVETLLKLASMTATDYMHHARQEIDRLFGEGYAENNPVLVAAFMQTAAADFGAASMAKIVGEALEEISGSLRDIAHAVEDLESR